MSARQAGEGTGAHPSVSFHASQVLQVAEDARSDTAAISASSSSSFLNGNLAPPCKAFNSTPDMESLSTPYRVRRLLKQESAIIENYNFIVISLLPPEKPKI